MEQLGHPVFDADNHYYEAEERRGTRHLDPALGPRCVQWATIDGRRYHRDAAGHRAARSANATFDPISKPGCLYDYSTATRGRRSRSTPPRPRANWTGPRHHQLDSRRWDEAEGSPAAGCFRPLGMVYERVAAPRPRGGVPHLPCVQSLAARRLGLRPHRPHPRPAYLTLADTAWAVDELEWFSPTAAQLVVIRASAPTTHGRATLAVRPDVRSVLGSGVMKPASRSWSHAGDGGSVIDGYAVDGSRPRSGWGSSRSLQGLPRIEKAVHDFCCRW